MKVIALPRGAGKTTEILKLMDDNEHRVLLVPNEQQVRLCRNIADSLGVNVPKGNIVALAWASARLQGASPNTELYIDNLDSMLNAVLGVTNPIAAVTITTDE